MRILLLLALLAMPAAAQPRGVAVHDGSWVGMRTLQCRVGGRLQRERVTMTIRNGEVTVPGLLGDPELVGTVDAQGRPNLAPYSFFNAISSFPPMVYFNSEGRKDSLNNVEATGEFTCSLVSAPLARAMNATSAPSAPGVSETTWMVACPAC